VSRRPQLFIVPYDSGHKGLRMGAGPLRLRAEIDLPATEIEDTADFQCENVTAFRLYRQLAARIAQHRDAMPVVFSGNCGAAIGTAAGIGIQDLGIIWFDAHGDFNTPETSPSGFLDGMALSILTGGCWTTAASSIPAFFPIDTDRVIHAGGHDWDPGELESLRESGAGVILPGEDPSGPIETLSKRARRLIVHVDIDVLDTRYGTANAYAKPGGMSPEEVRGIITKCGGQFEIAAVVIASYDPSLDGDGRIARAASAIAETAMSFC
jgi:arginase